MATQSYENHVQLVTGFHKVLLPVLFLTFIGSVVNLSSPGETISASTARR
jgi:hypothetical protein